MENSQNLVCKSKRPLWQLLIAALFFTLTIVLCYFFFTGFESGMQGNRLNNHIKTFRPIIGTFFTGIGFSMNRVLHFDKQGNRYKIEFVLGFLKLGKWNKIDQFDYVSVFKQPLADGKKSIDVLVWYNSNKRIKVYRLNDIETAFVTAKKRRGNLILTFWTPPYLTTTVGFL
ncbi:hypothetical protein ACJD0Z_16960 [Flavobacteriaceae bacterium M23B6Z8]